MKIEMNYNGVTVEVEFNYKLNLLSGFSGTGKTFLMQAMELYCLNNSIKYVYADYRFMNYSLDQIKSTCKDAHVALLDNADLYFTDDLLNWFKKQKDMQLVFCMKDTSDIDMENVHEYIVHYRNQRITIEEF